MAKKIPASTTVTGKFYPPGCPDRVFFIQTRSSFLLLFFHPIRYGNILLNKFSILQHEQAFWHALRYRRIQANTNPLPKEKKMKKHDNRKKIVLGLALIGAVALVGIQTAGAGPRGGNFYGMGGPQGPGYCTGYGYNNQQLSQESQKARDTFMKDTVALRKDMATRMAEKRALMISENPDAARVAQLTSEIFDIREQLRTKADESGLTNVGLMGMGMGSGRGPGMGMGRGHGRGCNGHGGYFQGQL
jgi:zinc resistance-associated protein